jgi:hypothetical protein
MPDADPVNAIPAIVSRVPPRPPACGVLAAAGIVSTINLFIKGLIARRLVV